jgi:hypothetical protein
VTKVDDEYAILVDVVDDSLVGTLPATIQGVEVVVQVTGEITPKRGVTTDPDASPPATREPQRKSRFRPVPIGVSMCHVGCTACTSSYHLEDPDTGELYIAGNYHCHANLGNANPGDPILQPAPYDGGENPNDKVAELVDWVPLQTEGNLVDLSWVKPTTKFENSIYGIGAPISGEIYEPEPGDTVVKSGRTTGVVAAEVIAVDVTVTVPFPDGNKSFTQQIQTGYMSDGGDSSSATLYKDEDGIYHPVGLLFAGSSSSTIHGRAANVEKESGLRIVTEGGGVGVTCSSHPVETVAGQPVWVDATVTNQSDEQHLVTIQTFVDAQAASDPVTVTVGAGAEKNVKNIKTPTPTEAGSYDVETHIVNTE